MGVAPYDMWVSQIARDPYSRQVYEKNRGKYANEGGLVRRLRRR